MKSLKEIITGDAKFLFYRHKELWYEVNGFKFPVPIDDTGDGTFLAEDKGIFFMRWIKLYIAAIKQKEEEK